MLKTNKLSELACLALYLMYEKKVRRHDLPRYPEPPSPFWVGRDPFLRWCVAVCLPDAKKT